MAAVRFGVQQPFPQRGNKRHKDRTGDCMIVYLIAYAGSYALARGEHYYLSGILLILAALWLYLKDYRQFVNLIHLRGLFSLFWVGGQGLACLKLLHFHMFLMMM